MARAFSCLVMSGLGVVLLGGCLSPDNRLDDDDDSDDDDASTQGEGTSTTPTGGTDPTTPTPPDTGTLPSDCNGDLVRLATYNIEGVGASGTEQFSALSDTLGRIDADVVCMQEVGDADAANLAALASGAGYDFVVEAEPSPAIGGELRNACIGKVPVTLVDSFTGGELSAGFANDVGRDILAVRAEPVPGCFVGLLTVHLKSGEEETDRFRRQVEVERLLQAVGRYRGVRPVDAIVILGDFNERIDAAELGMEFGSEPAGLPNSYTVGPDIGFPLVYQPFASLSGFTRVDANWEDSSRNETWREASRLDYVFFGQATLQGAEVYNACEDDGVDDDPPGGRLDKPGEPLNCFISATASDHLPVVVDLVLP